MDNLELIGILDTCMKLAIAAAILFLVLAVVFFFVFKIPQIYMIKTGKAQRRTIEKMSEVNAETGRLSMASKGMSGIFGSSSDLDALTMTSEISNSNPQQYQQSAQPQQYQQPVQETSVLSQQPTPAPVEEIVPDESYGKFIIVKNLIKIHTDEVI